MYEIKICFIIGAALAALYTASFIVCYFCQWVWAWVDDSKPEERCWLVVKVMAGLGYKYAPEGESWRYYKIREKELWGYSYAKGSDGEMILLPLIALSLAPITIYFMVIQYELTLILLLTLAVLFGSRGLRRLYKKVDKHVEDKDAHKGLD